ncbi:O-methyltransferase [Tessaracoccus sp. OH4464_COT-324]|uniref:O-methyltransferase n=1 Tax=Tessaracoccus sp. OH4464_COT-324 TaxID=2491059 RepID=UPI00131A2971|nr:hypothetical protein [Tessaracoccus sp. OH4464_COT-324]
MRTSPWRPPNAEVSPNQGAFPGLVAQLAGARRILEFGTWPAIPPSGLRGPSDLPGEVVTLDLGPQNAEVSRANFALAAVADRITVIEGPAAAESAQRLIEQQAGPLDMVFIDADKPSNPAYLGAALQLT